MKSIAHNTPNGRRVFVVHACVGACALATLPIAALAAAQVEESDENAVALGYKHDTKKVDAAKYPKHAAAQRCANCGLYQGAATDAWGGCAMFGRKQVAGPGWCMAWVGAPGRS
ncbi:high-potential iron-sulfur protein [Variovorax sp. J22R133]|uniref:high-potential iron-sulfur protein n=1 Tax=Variovorax brevis TaxID=3053503 RepID=UPI0025776947|nr:high-potential iron-sulfur protein [Variovorax sp. J22R133]MDM0111306.1 high-potential iron-sulfur protein [Variovorax sp. J22R133]